ncbi:hypothetical protein FIBSPDRAFT_919371 [Athelia psychrophila]|uniref:Uncharacterized protein n=1 Tax=Athelia psychrophila TaxID=1759441 RepID=A0A166KY15_9AGAM|nr:hypothetical protein FIBSPDRAFT_919371 [Fibularhizoctonia sp. CBS 109695]
MANLSRTAKSGNDWTRNDLKAYNIEIVNQSIPTFFGMPQLPELPENLRSFADTQDRTEAADDATHKLLHYLDLAHNPKMGQELAVDTFAERLLQTLGYDSWRRLILTRQELPFFICGEKRGAEADICICDENDILLLVQADKCLENPDDPQAQLIAEAIAAFQRNNLTRNRDLHLPELDKMTIPGITLVGTTPIFYHIKITAALNEAVMRGTFPPFITEVYRHVPQLPRRNSEGMKPADNRAKISRYFLAFRGYIVGLAAQD